MLRCSLVLAQVGSRFGSRFPRVCVRCAMLSQAQVDILKTPTTVIEIQGQNPKKTGSKSFERFDRYKSATTIGDATTKGANWQDLSTDFEKGYLKVPHLMDVEAQGPGGAKRTAPEGTPDREAEARSKMASTELMPRVLVQENQDPVSKVEMSAATISALRAMMRDEIKNGMMEMEQRFSNKLDSAIHGIKEELAAEKVARQQLEDRISHLEHHRTTTLDNGKMFENDDVEEVNKSVVVIGGFIEKALEEAEAMVQQMMIGISGYKEVEMIDNSPPIALATFESPMQAMKFIRSQKKNATIQTNKLWASENRSKTERLRCKVLSKLKKYMIEVGGVAAKDVVASYKTFRMVLKKDGRLLPVAIIREDVSVQWLDDVAPDVREALEAFMEELE